MNHVFLGLLAGGPRHGYDLKRLYDAQFPGARPLAYGQVYATLQRLQKEGHVEVDGTVQGSGPERTVYRITDPGREVLAAWLDEPEPPSAYAGSELVRKTLMALHLGADAARFLARQRQVHLARMRELLREQAAAEAAAGPSEGVVPGLGADYAVAHLDADLRWLETTTERVARARTAADAPAPAPRPGDPR